MSLPTATHPPSASLNRNTQGVQHRTYEELKELETSAVTEEEIDYFLACHALECVSSYESDSSQSV